MAPRVHYSGRLVNGSAGLVHISRYTGAITLELTTRSQEDYVEHCARLGQETTPVVLIPDKPFPLPGIDVRTYWRDASTKPGFEGVAMILPGVVGLMAATVTSFGEQLVGVLNVNIRSFKKSDDAAVWLVNRFNCEVDEFDLMDAIDEVNAVFPEPDADAD